MLPPPWLLYFNRVNSPSPLRLFTPFGTRTEELCSFHRPNRLVQLQTNRLTTTTIATVGRPQTYLHVRDLDLLPPFMVSSEPSPTRPPCFWFVTNLLGEMPPLLITDSSTQRIAKQRFRPTFFGTKPLLLWLWF